MVQNRYSIAAPLLLCCAILLFSSPAHCTSPELQHPLDAHAQAAGGESRRYVVVLTSQSANVSAASDRLRTYAIDAVAATPAASTTGSASSRGFVLHRVIGSAQSPDSTGQAAFVSDVPQAGPASSASRVQGLLISARPDVAAKLWQSPDVTAVIPDTLVELQRHLTAHTPTRCMDCSQLALLTTQGISVSPNSRFKWPKCYNAQNTKLVWSGHLCGPQSNQIIFTSLEAVDAATGQPKPACKLTAAMDKPAAWIRQRFGSCGKAPLHAPSLPTQLCDLQQTSDCMKPSDSLAGDPLDAVIEPTDASAAGSQRPQQARMLPRESVADREDVPFGVSRIQAYRQGTIIRIPKDLPASRQVAVGVIDSGIHGQHPDLNVVGGKSLLKDDGTLESMGQGRGFEVRSDDMDPRVDKYGHGTHIAGIVGARNQGSGIIGVSPGIPLYALKVNNAYGKGAMSWVLEAVKWVVTTGLPQHNIRVINLSLSFYISPSAPSYQQMKDAVCSYFDEATKAGIVVVAAAGNQGTIMEGHFPASCPGVAAVTALDASGKAPGSYSNYWPASTVSDEAKGRTFLAPGTGILSTVSPQVSTSLYYKLQGTSQASPHVAAVAANCLMSGACPVQSSGREVISTLWRAAERRASVKVTYGLRGYSAGGKFYGPVVYSAY